MAEAYGKLTGRPGICFVTRGPGATNASIGVHTAFQDSTPMILFIGQVGSEFAEREAFQEIDYRRMFGQMAKWVAQIDRAERVPEMVSHAFHLAMSGRPGPVVLALPEDMLTATASGRRHRALPARRSASRRRRHEPAARHAGAGAAAVRDAGRRRLERAGVRGLSGVRRGQCAAGGAAPSAARTCSTTAIRITSATSASASIRRSRSASAMPTCCSRSARGWARWTTIDYTLIDIPRPKQKFVHVHAGAEELGRVYQGDLLINSGMPEFAAAARALAPVKAPWADATKAARAEYEAWQKPVADAGRAQHERSHRVPAASACRRKRSSPTAPAISRCGCIASINTPVFAPSSGRPAARWATACRPASRAKLVHPERPVISFAGDGDFLMNGQELATAAQYGAKVIFIVVNNGMYGTIRMHQERHYPGRVSGTELRNPDFAALARAYGLHGEIVEKTADFAAAFERAWNAQDRGADRTQDRSRCDLAAHDAVGHPRGSAEE